MTLLTNSNSPRYDIAGIFRRRDHLMKSLASRYANVNLEGPNFAVFVSDVCRELPSTCKAEAVAHSLFELVGSSPSAKDLFHIFWRLAANTSALSSGVAVHPWNDQSGEEWAPVQIVDVKPSREFNKSVYEMTFQLLGGPACPLRVFQKWSTKKVYYLAQRRDEQGYGFMFSRKAGGRSRRVPKYPFENVRQLFGLRLLVLLDPELSDDGPGFREIRFTSSLSTFNRELIKKRARLENPYVCPKGLLNTTFCHSCHYGKEDCSMACHVRTYVPEICPSCESESYFDPQNVVSMFCVNCTDKKRRQGENI